jgi:hypothetical protein
LTDQPQTTPEESDAGLDGLDSVRHDGEGRARTFLQGALLVVAKLAIGFAIPIVIVIVLAIVAQVVISDH